MKISSLSTLGRIMNALDIRTSDMARALHVDASLVSKWRTGVRSFKRSSPYFEDAAVYLSQSCDDAQQLAAALREFIPANAHSEAENPYDMVVSALLADSDALFPHENDFVFGTYKTAPMLTLDGISGRQEGVRRALDYAETLDTGGELIIVDSEEFAWLLADSEYLAYFKHRVLKLLEKGFTAKIVLHYSASAENFRHFFELCSPILFNRRVEWYYSEYYDESVMNVSMLTAARSVMVLGISVNAMESTTMLFTDKPSIERHYRLMWHIIKKCTPIFYDFEPSRLLNVVDAVPVFRKSTVLYSFLPVPAFIAIRPSLLKPILADNNVDAETMEHVLKLNHAFRLVVKSYNPKLGNSRDSFVQIFQLEKFVERVKKRSFISSSLTNICGRNITITAERHAAALRHLVDTLTVNDNVSIIMASEKDYVFMPPINCWVKDNSYMLQMDKHGFRASDESIAVSAASVALAHCVRRVPPERRDKRLVMKFLSELAEELECGD